MDSIGEEYANKRIILNFAYFEAHYVRIIISLMTELTAEVEEQLPQLLSGVSALKFDEHWFYTKIV